MKNIWTIMWFELLRMLRVKQVLVLQFILPLILIFILGNALSSLIVGKEISPEDRVHVTILNELPLDSQLSIGLARFLESTEVTAVMSTEYGTSREDLDTSLRSGGTEFGVVIPATFEQSVMSGGPAQWELLLGSNHMKNTIAELVFGSFLDEVNRDQSIASVLGTNVMQAIAPVESSISDNKETIHSYVQDASVNREGKSYSAFQYYAGAMLIMFLLYSGMGASSSLSGERKGRTLYRLNSMPVSSTEIFMGKILGNTLIAFLQAMAIIGCTSWLYGVDWGRDPLLLALICLLVIIASMTLSIVVTFLIKSSTTAQMVIQFLIIVMTFLSGGFSPISNDLIQILSKLTVNHWALQGILRAMLYESTGEVMHYAFMLIIMCGVLVLASTLVYRKVGYHE